MGRESRRKHTSETRYTLERGDYFELRSLIRDVEAIELDALKAAQHFARQQADAIAKRNAKFEALAKQYSFDPTLTYRWDDAKYELIASTATLQTDGT